MRFFFITALLGACLLTHGYASAQASPDRQARIAEAKRAFTLGTTAYELGEFETALLQFRRAYELTKSPDLLYNIASVADRLRLDADALEAYRGYLAARPGSEDRDHVEGRIGVLESAIRAREEADLEARRAAAEAAAQVRSERPLTEYVGPGPGPWITMGAGGASVVAGAVLIGIGQRDQNRVSNAPDGSPFSSYEDYADRGPRLTKAGIGMLSVGAAGVLGGMIWQLAGGGEQEIPEVSIGPTGVSIRGRF